MAHPARAAAAEALAIELGATITWDQVGDEWDTGRRALAAFDPTASHHVVLQDDALPVDDFTAHATAALNVHPDALVSFYLGTSYPADWQPSIDRALTAAADTGASWARCSRLLHGVAIALPTRLIPGILETADRFTTPYDRRVGDTCRYAGIPILYTIPSLVDHDDGPTLVQHYDDHRPANRNLPRHAHRYGTPVSWNTDAVRI